MAILGMNSITVYGMIHDRENVIKRLQRAGAVQVEEIRQEGLRKESAAKWETRINRDTETVEKALAVIERYVPHKDSFLKSRPTASAEVRVQRHRLLEICSEITGAEQSIAEADEKIKQLSSKAHQLEPYFSCDVPLGIGGTEHTVIKTGRVQGKADERYFESAMRRYPELMAHIEILSVSKEQTVLWIVYMRGSEDAEKLLCDINFEETAMKTELPPKSEARRLRKNAEELETKKKEYTERIKALSKECDELRLLYDTLLIKKQQCQAAEKTGRTRYVFILKGYVPKKSTRHISDLLENSGCVCEIEDAEGSPDTPRAFENNAFASAVEGVTATYSLPSPRDIDPNAIMAFFYYLFFGMMFSDAGYGMLVMLVCGALAFGSRLEPEKRGMFRMFFFCGISTVFWGFMYGSFFGNAVSAVSETFLGRTAVLRPLWIDPVSEPLKLLIFSVILGLIQILVGMGISFYMLVRDRRFSEAFFDVGLWMLVLIFAAVFAAGAGLGISGIGNIGLYGMAASAIGLVLTQGSHKKGIIGKALGGVVSLYGITSYVSDILSYSRLMALGLATGVIANVVNILGTISGNIAMFVVISIIGHGMNFAINMLGAYVHTNRLQYVEFYSKFYEGGGRAYKPLRLDSRYYRFE